MAEVEADAILMGQLQGGEEKALESIYGKYRSLLYSVAFQIVGDSGAAEEILQDTFFKLWQVASKFDSAKGSLTGWLLVMTRNRALSRLRNKQFVTECGDDLTLLEDKVPTALHQQITRQLVSSALSGIPKAQQEAITLAYFEGLSSAEISARIKAPLGTVKARLRSGLRGMKSTLIPSAETKRARVTLNDILITHELMSRPVRERSPHQETTSLRILERASKVSPDRLVDVFLKLALDLCNAGTAGLSLLELVPEEQPVFRWTNLVGTLEDCVGGTTPRDFSPCGVTLDRNSPQLFSYPSQYFHYFNKVTIPIVEGLVIPFHIRDKTVGTVWIVSHQANATFDSEDVRIMTTLTEYAGSALHLSRALSTRPVGS